MPKNPHPKSTTADRSSPPHDRFNLLVEAVESIHDYGIFMLDSLGYILTWNKGAERLKGYSTKEIIGSHFSRFYIPEDLERQHPQNELQEARRAGRYEEEGWRVRKDGSRFWASVVITTLTNREGLVIGFSKVTRDLSQRKEMEERLRSSEERFRLLVEGVKDYAIVMLDPQGRISSWNQGAERIKGYTAHEVMGKYFSIFYPEKDIASGKCEFELKEAAAIGRFEDEGWRLRKDGSLLWAHVVITAIRNKNDELIGFTKVTRDLTEKKQATDQLHAAYADLERRVLERTNDLSEAVRVRDEFLSIASHELKTPITSLKMQLQIIERRAKANPNESIATDKFNRSLKISLNQVERLSRLVEDLLDVARSQAQKLSFTFEPTDLRMLVDEVGERYREQLEAAQCRLEICGQGSTTGSFDRFRLDQVLVNLLTNAIKYAPGTKIQISLSSEQNGIRLEVGDQGPGICPASQEKLFQRFERGSNARNIGGLGLGLFITKQIVEGHGGRIELKSQLGQGSRFIVHLPINHEV